MLRMNIKTITCHHVYNYGASLQAFALQKYLTLGGHHVQIIDYRLPSQNRYELFILPQSLSSKISKLIKLFPFFKYIIAPYKNRYMLRTWGRKEAFDKFDKVYLQIATPIYRNYEDIKNNPPKADIYIAGSDQIWNPKMPNGTDLGYYLNFGDNKAKRISYAASFGVKEISKQQGVLLSNELKKFNAISVREISGIKILDKLGIHAVRCVDPVFLLNKDEWIDFLKIKKMQDKYILLYDFNHNDANIRNFAVELSSKKNLKIFSINDSSPVLYANKQINNAGPIEFLTYLFNAEYVVSNSFHATAFSIIFHKKFATFPLKNQNNPSRMIDLLECVDLLNHFSPKDINCVDEPYSWDTVSAILEKDIRFSKKYLENQCR